MRGPLLNSWMVALGDPQGPAMVLPARPLSAQGLREFVPLADHHGVLPAVVCNLRRLPRAAFAISDADWEGSLAEADGRIVKRAGFCLMLRAQLRSLRTLFERRNVPMVVLKGPEFADRLYADASLRAFTDLDVLVPKDSWDRSSALLEETGYRWQEERPGADDVGYAQRSWHPTRETGGTLELHWDLVNSPSMRRRVSIRYESLEFDMKGRLTAESLLLIAAVHGATGHKFDRMQLLCDVRQAVRGFAGALDPERLRRQALAMGALTALGAALSVAGEVLREPACTDLLRRMRLPLSARLVGGLLAPSAVLDERGLSAVLRRQLFREMLKHV